MPTFQRPARLYLISAALLTFGLAIAALFYNLVLVELGYDTRTLAVPVVGELSLLGILNSLPVLMAALSSLPLWWLVSVVGPRRALMAAALLHAGALLVVALRPEPLPLLLSSLLGGPASVLVQVSAAPFMMRHSGPNERDSLFALSAGINIGVGGLGALVGGVLPGIAVQWFDLAAGAAAYRATFAVAAGCTAMAAIPLLLIATQRIPTQMSPPMPEDRPAVLPPQPIPAHREPRHPFRLFGGLRERIAQSSLNELFAALPLALRFMAAPFIISCGAALLIPFLNLYFRQRFAVPDANLGLIFAAISIVTGLATLAAPALSARLGKMRSVVVSQALAVPCLLLLGLAPTLWLAVPVALARGALMNMAAPLYDAYAMERSPERARPMVIGMINGAFSAGYIIGPTISAQVQLRYGFGPLFVATAVCYAIAVAVTYLLFLRPRAA